MNFRRWSNVQRQISTRIDYRHWPWSHLSSRVFTGVITLSSFFYDDYHHDGWQPSCTFSDWKNIFGCTQTIHCEKFTKKQLHISWKNRRDREVRGRNFLFRKYFRKREKQRTKNWKIKSKKTRKPRPIPFHMTKIFPSHNCCHAAQAYWLIYY